jgi:hypothetical protein
MSNVIVLHSRVVVPEFGGIGNDGAALTITPCGCMEM